MRILIFISLFFMMTCVCMEKEGNIGQLHSFTPTLIEKLMTEKKATIAQKTIVNEYSIFTNTHIDYDRVYNYPMEKVLKKYISDYGVTVEQAEITEMEFKTFITNASQVKYPSRMKDRSTSNLWHTFLLFSRDYYMFCFRCFGRMVHHDPSICDMLSSSVVCNSNPCDSGR
jgi:hypothetical protein